MTSSLPSPPHRRQSDHGQNTERLQYDRNDTADLADVGFRGVGSIPDSLIFFTLDQTKDAEHDREDKQKQDAEDHALVCDPLSGILIGILRRRGIIRRSLPETIVLRLLLRILRRRRIVRRHLPEVVTRRRSGIPLLTLRRAGALRSLRRGRRIVILIIRHEENSFQK